MNLVQLGLILKSRWWVIATALAIGLLLALAAIATSSTKYVATAQVLVNVRAPDTVGGDLGVAPQLAPDYLATQIDVIRSDRVAMAAVRRLGLTSDPEALKSYRESGTRASPEVYLADTIRNGLSILPSTESRVIAINYLATDPAYARAVANAFANAYRDVSLELQREPAQQASGWYEQSAATLRRQLATAQARLSARRAELGVTASSEQSDADEAQLAQLAGQLASAQAARATEASRASGGALPAAQNSSVVQSLTTDLARAEAQRRQLGTFAGPNNVDYQQLTNQINGLRAELGRARAEVAGAASVSSAQSAQNVATLRGDLEGQRRRVIASQRARGEISALEQDVANLKSTYEQVVAKQAQTNLLGAANQTNVSILSPASMPLRAAGTSWLVKLIGGLAVSGLLGLLVAFAIEFLDQRIRSPEDASVWLGIPNLGGVRSLHGGETRLIGQSVRRYLPRPSEGGAS